MNNTVKTGLKRKTLIPIISIMVAIILSLTIVSMINLYNAFNDDERHVKEGFDINLTIAVETMISLLDQNHKLHMSYAQQGLMTQEEAYNAGYEAARDMIRWARFSTSPNHKDDGYFWADMKDGTCIAHYQHHLDGTEPRNRWETLDRNPVESEKKYYVREIIQNAGKFTEFYTNHPDDLDGNYKKIAYTLYFEPYQWFVSTGNYYIDIDAIMDDIESQKMMTLILLIAISVTFGTLGVVIVLKILSGIVRPLTLLSGFMHKAGTTGDITMTPQDAANVGRISQRNDEIGAIVANTASFVGHVVKIADELERVAKGDLTTELDILSSDDIMGNALQHMVDNLNKLFGEINQSTSQVASGSRQIADGSQLLAQGSTQQASAVEELSSEVKQIAEQTQQNSEMANKAAGLGNTIKAKAETGSRQMDEMMEAVRDINQASQSIGKVIKTIDDIAFQTNILALNAAVEAARAGQHGKGFAVVAEEVRNLATKSADAAKETGNMIANSIEKAELGSRIAGSTAESLTEIVAGINESSQIVNQIASSSESQSAGIAQINSGIDQVAKVVQQNSATAEQSAAAAEEMSGQSATLEDLVAQFKLKGSEGTRQINMSGKTPGNNSYGKY
ncbi:MAG: methyl-accepting chemotaxis protein [Oscillospiraceae bacterium]|nr:methyl-accepting chemotaxis protein [Oscillospiraceae bacterium]